MRRGKKLYSNSIIWIGAFAGCVVFAGAMLLGVLFGIKDSASMRSQLENSYKRSFLEMADSIEGMETNLSKMLVSASEEQTVEIASQITRQAQQASICLNQLPLSDESAHDINKFFNQVGDWCASYSHALLLGGETSEYEDKIEEIFVAACNVNAEIKDIATDFAAPRYSIVKSLRRRGVRSSPDLTLPTDSLKGGEIQYPKMVYDGDFSDMEGKKCFKALENLEQVSKEQAQANLNQIFGSQKLRDLRCFAQTTEPDAFEFVGTLGDGTAYMSVSKNGGKLLSLNTDLTSQHSVLDAEQAQHSALAYAKKCGYDCELSPVYYSSSDNVAYVNIAPKTNGIIYYPDLIKVKVGLDDGKLIAFEATGYCKTNCERDLTPLITESAAKSAASPKLTITQSRLALIPTGNTETLTYELTATYKGIDYKIYIDAQTAKEVEIRRI